MPEKLITYDLSQPHRNYNALIAKIKTLGGYCHLQGSVWIVTNDLTAAQVRDRLLPVLDSDDKIYVAALSGEAAWWNLDKERSDWILSA